jgi:hypothetical protein
MKRKFELISLLEDKIAPKIEGIWYNSNPEYGARGTVALLQNGKKIPLDANEAPPYHDIYKLQLVQQRPNGKYKNGPDGRSYPCFESYATLECENYDDKYIKDKLYSDLTSTDHATRQKAIEINIIRSLKEHSEVWVDGPVMNKNLPNKAAASFKLVDITDKIHLETTSKRKYISLANDFSEMFENKYSQFVEICYGIGLGEAVRKSEIDGDRNILWKAFDTYIEADPKGFEDLYRASGFKDNVIFNKGVEAGFISLNGSVYFFEGEPLGTDIVECVAWFKLNPKSYELLKTKLSMSSPRKVSDADPVGFDRQEFDEKTVFETKAEKYIKSARIKYKDNPIALQELENAIAELKETKGWTLEG